MKQHHTLVSDIDNLFRGPHKVNEENLRKFGEDITNIVKRSLEEAGVPREFTLRMSNIGTPDRKLWYDAKEPNTENFSPSDYRKFMYGHILESLLIFLAREAGHEVTNEQDEVTLEGIVGHKDCHIDGVLTDVKSASSYQFSKFVNGDFPAVDPFGYGYQLKGYFEADPTESDEFSWLVIDKTNGNIELSSFHEFEFSSAKQRIIDVKSFLASDEPPERCYVPEVDKNGNKPLPKNCEYCRHKFKCWDNIRTFKYSTGNKYYIHVEKEPRVAEA